MPFFSPMRNASAKGLVMNTPFNNNLPTQIGDVIINPGNPVNPASKCHETVLLYNNLPTQIGDVIINPGNPVNPVSKCHETVLLYK